MNTIAVTRFIIFTQRLLETYIAKQKAKKLNLILWVAFSVFALFTAGIRVGQSIGELAFNLTR